VEILYTIYLLFSSSRSRLVQFDATGYHSKPAFFSVMAATQKVTTASRTLNVRSWKWQIFCYQTYVRHANETLDVCNSKGTISHSKLVINYKKKKKRTSNIWKYHTLLVVDNAMLFMRHYISLSHAAMWQSGPFAVVWAIYLDWWNTLRIPPWFAHDFSFHPAGVMDELKG
jgi:hypothetical protein